MVNNDLFLKYTLSVTVIQMLMIKWGDNSNTEVGFKTIVARVGNG